MKKFVIPAAISALLASAPAFAHPGHAVGLGHGLLHPYSGLDHVLAMIAVGLWAGQQGGSAQWKIPAAFVAAMLLGSLLGLVGFALPFVEAGIVTSVLLLGLLVAFALRLPAMLGMGLMALFALFHGHAHGSEAGSLAQSSYIVGFMLATASLHGIGLAAGWLLRHRAEIALRLGGLAVAAGGMWLALN